MRRRHVLASMGAATAGASALVGTGAFSRVESQRDVTIEVVGDEDAYLGLRYGDLEVECGQVVTFVKITNQLKQSVKIDDVGFDEIDDIELSDPWFVRCETEEGEDEEFGSGEYLDVGRCVEVRVAVLECPPEGASVEVPFDVEVSDDDVLVIAQGSGDRQVEIDCDCPRDPGLSWVAFCGDVDAGDIVDLQILYDDEYTDTDTDLDEGVRWTLRDGFDGTITGVVLFGGYGEFTAREDYNQLFLNYEYSDEMTEVMLDRDDPDDLGSDELVVWEPPTGTETGQHPSCPCRDERTENEWLDEKRGVKFEVDDVGQLNAEDGEGFDCR